MDLAGKKIGIFISFTGQGGVERMINNLAQGFLQEGYEVDMIFARAQGGHLGSVPEGVRQIRLGTRHTFSALPGLTKYLMKEKPSALLAAKDRAIRVAILARLLARSDVFLAGRIGTTVSAALEGRHSLKRWAWYRGMKFFYRFADRIIAVSEGVARDLMTITSLPPDRVVVIPNPVITPELERLAAEPVSHPWLQYKEVPVIMGMGRLTLQKDFPTLIRAFARVRDKRDCRLLILGNGGQLSKLRELASELKIEKDIQFPGFKENPYSYLSKCSLFVLSSLWEGSPNALTEALSLGVPVVSTNCRSGPGEILQGGRYGPLVNTGDYQGMAAEIHRILENPPTPDVLRSAVSRFTLEESANGYLKVLGLIDT